MNFSSMELSPIIQKALKQKGYTKPTPIQELSIPPLLLGKDLLGIAQTGTGKTAAFSLPIINFLIESKKRNKSKSTRVLILTPTRELASQIEDNIKDYSKNSNIKTAVVFGGVGKTPQIVREFGKKLQFD